MYDEESETENNILGCFSLAIQILKLHSKQSNNKVKKLDGFNAKINNEPITEFPAILIGQFAKNSECNELFNGDSLMNFCNDTILKGQTYLGGRIVLLECKNKDKLIEFYNKHGFTLIDEGLGDNDLLKMFRTLSKDELIEN